MSTWLNRLACQHISPWDHPDAEIVDLCTAYQRRDVEIHLFHLPTDHPCHVFVAIGMQSGTVDGPAAVVGMGADIDPVIAARKAILEVAQVRPALRRRMRQPHVRQHMQELVEDPRQVRHLEDHDLLYASSQMLHAFDFLVQRPIQSFDWLSYSSQTAFEKLHTMVQHLSSQGTPLLYVNLTPPDMQSLGLYTARVILPGYQPIDFGWAERRLGGDRLYELPKRLGYAAQRTRPEELNHLPHPVS